MTGLPDPAVQPTMSVAEVSAVLGVCRGTVYEAVRTKDIPSLRLGSRIVIPTAALRRMLKLDDDHTTPDGPEIGDYANSADAASLRYAVDRLNGRG